MGLNIRHETMTLYLQPLREGGSLPGLVEASDGFRYAAKFRGAGHGTKALIAEFIGSELARIAGFRVPELVLLDLGPEFGRREMRRFKTSCVAARGLILVFISFQEL